jgi:hypothetical protein
MKRFPPALVVLAFLLAAATLAAAAPAAAAVRAEIDVRGVRFTSSGSVRVSAFVTCSPRFRVVTDPTGTPQTWMRVVQTLHGGQTVLVSDLKSFQGQVVCDGRSHRVRKIFPGDAAVERFNENAPLTVIAIVHLVDPPGVPIELDAEETFVFPTRTSSREPVAVDVTNLRFGVNGGVRVRAFVKCPDRYRLRLASGDRATVDLEQRFYKRKGGSIREIVRVARKDVSRDIVCDGTRRIFTQRFAGDRTTHRPFKHGIPIRVRLRVTVSTRESASRVTRGEAFVR